jgi:hypothetical protein
LEKAGMDKEKASDLLNHYIQLSRKLPIPEVLDFHNPERFSTDLSPYLQRNQEIHDLMFGDY